MKLLTTILMLLVCAGVQAAIIQNSWTTNSDAVLPNPGQTVTNQQPNVSFGTIVGNGAGLSGVGSTNGFQLSEGAWFPPALVPGAFIDPNGAHTDGGFILTGDSWGSFFLLGGDDTVNDNELFPFVLTSGSSGTGLGMFDWGHRGNVITSFITMSYGNLSFNAASNGFSGYWPHFGDDIPQIVASNLWVQGSEIDNSTISNATYKGVLSGNGGGLTNIQPIIISTNWVDGKWYTNTYGCGITVYAPVKWTTAGVAGDVNEALWIVASPIVGGTTNFVAEQTLLTSLAQSVTNSPCLGFVPTNAAYAWTNLSGGAGDSAGVLPGQIKYP